MSADQPLVDEPQSPSRRKRTRLRFRILDPQGRSRLIRLHRRKCTIGGSPECTIELAGSRARPVHCLIICGERETIVRNLSPGNTLNGRPFNDAPLFPGDHLRLAGHDIEILALKQRTRPPLPTGGAFRETPSSLDLASAIESRMNRIEEQLFDLQRDQTSDQIGHLRQTVRRLERRAETERRRHADRRRQWRAERSQLLKQLQAHGSELDRLDQEAAPPTAGQDPAETQIRSELERELDALKKSFDASQKEQLRLQQDWQAERHQLQNLLTTAQHRIQELEADLAVLQQQQSEPSPEVQQTEAAELSEKLRELAAKLAETQQQHDEDRQAWESERAEMERQLVSLGEQLCNKKRLFAESQHAHLEQIQQLQLQLETERHEHQESSKAWEAERAATSAATVPLTDTTPRDEIVSSPPTPPLDPPDWYQPHTGPAEDNPLPPQFLGSGEGVQDGTGGETRSLPLTPDRGLASADQSPSQPTGPSPSNDTEAPVSTADVLNRMQISAFEVEEEAPVPPDTAEPEATAASSGPSDVATPTLAELSDVLPTDDESIEAYMNHLLARVRGDKSPPPPAVVGSPGGPLVETVAPEEDANQPSPHDFIPRRPAPERDVSLAAMRSLANESARSALKSHAARSWTEAAKYQLFASALGATCGIATFISLDTRPIAGFVILLVGSSVASVFGMQAMRIRRELLDQVRQEETAEVENSDTAPAAED